MKDLDEMISTLNNSDVVFVLISGYEGVFEGLCHTTQTAFAEVPDTEASQIEAL
jgi:hypothetical protein